MRNVKVSGIVLHSREMFEKDRLIELATVELGRIRVLVKYANSGKSSLRGKIEPTSYVSMIVSQGKGFIWTQQVDLLDSFYKIRESFNGLSLAGYFLQVVRSATVHDQSNQALFTLLHHSLERIHNGDHLENIQTDFQHAFIQLEGLCDEEMPTLSFGQFQRLFESYSGVPLRAPVFV